MGDRGWVIVLMMLVCASAIGMAGAAEPPVGPMADTNGPTIAGDSTPSLHTLGTTLTFSVNLVDETGTNDAQVEMWQGTGSHSSLSMSMVAGTPQDGTWEASANPSGSLSPIRYVIHCNDTLGNYNASGSVGVVNLRDGLAPRIDDFTPVLGGKATTGDPFSFWANVTDESTVSEVRIHYYVGTPPWMDVNVTMDPMFTLPSGVGMYILNITIQDNTTESIVYQIMARDSSNNFRMLNGQVNVTDNDAPIMRDEGSGTAGTTGDPFHFEVDVLDNVEVGQVRVRYWYGSTTPVNKTMVATNVDASKSGVYTLDEDLAADHVGKLFFQYVFRDKVLLWGNSSVFQVNVTDNDPPTIVEDLSGAVGEDRFDFGVNVSDNIGVQVVWVEYFFKGEASSNVTMTPVDVVAGNGTYGNVGVEIPQDRQVELTYILGVMDGKGHVTTIMDKYENLDLERPTLGEEAVWGEPIKGKSMAVTVEAADNFGVAEVYIVYAFGDAAAKNDTMDDEGGVFNYTIHIPRWPAGDLAYSFHAVDLKGNWNSTTNRTVALVNLVPDISRSPTWNITEGDTAILDLAPYLVDGNDAVTDLTLTTDAPNVTVDQRRLTALYDEWQEDHTIEVIVSDGENSTTFSIDIHVINVNDLPIITSEPGKAAAVSIAYSYQVTFLDEDSWDSHNFSLDSSPAGMQVSASGLVTWTPTAGQEGPQGVDLVVNDGYASVHQYWTITVTERPTDEPPAFTNSAPTTHAAGTKYTFDADATDPDSPSIAFSLVEGPSGATVNPTTGLLEWTPAADKRDTSDNVDFVLRVTDGRNAVDLEWTVALSYPDNDPPTIASSVPKTVKVTRPTSVNLGEYMSDPDDANVDLTWTATTDSNIVEVHMNGNHLVITPKEGKEGKAKVTLTLADPWAESDSTEITLDINTVSDEGGALGGSMLYIVIAIVVVVVIVGLLFFMKGRKGPETVTPRTEE